MAVAWRLRCARGECGEISPESLRFTRLPDNNVTVVCWMTSWGPYDAKVIKLGFSFFQFSESFPAFLFVFDFCGKYAVKYFYI